MADDLITKTIGQLGAGGDLDPDDLFAFQRGEGPATSAPMQAILDFLEDHGAGAAAAALAQAAREGSAISAAAAASSANNALDRKVAAETAATNAATTYSAFISAAAGTQTFLTKTEANTALTSVPANTFIIVATDESQVGQRVLYRKTGGVYVFVRTIEERTIVPLAEQIIALQGNGVGQMGGLHGVIGDSLWFGTGSGGTATSPRKTYDAIMRANLGPGGPGWMGFSDFIAADTGAGFGKHATVNYVGITDGIYGQYSIDGYGLYVLAGDGTTSNFNWSPNTRWTNARIVYLKGPGMGSFKWKFSTQADGAATLIDCSAASLQLGYFDVSYTGDTKPILVFNQITGNVCVFGGDFKLNDTGYRPANLAKGGRKLQEIVAQDATFRQAWFTLLPFRQLSINIGMNDRPDRTAAQHNADLTALVTPIQAANPDTSILVIQSLEPADTSTTNFLAYAAEKQAVAKAKGLAYIDLRRFFGDYATAVASGGMLDGLHPNDKYNRLIGQILAAAKGMATGLRDPGLTPWSSGGGTAAQVLNGSLTRKQSQDITVAVGRTVLWKIGLINAFPQVAFDITVRGNRKGTEASTIKRALIVLKNGSTVNQAALPRTTSVPTVTTIYQVGAGGADPGTMYDFTIDVTINGNQAEIAVTPITYDGVFSANADFQFIYHSPTATGQTVYEN